MTASTRFIVALLPFVVLSACGSDSPETASGNDESAALEEEQAANVTNGGYFLSNCEDSGRAVVEEFVPAAAPVLPTGEVPDLDALLAGSPVTLLPVLGGFVPGAEEGQLVPISREEVEAMLDGALPADLPVIGDIRILCSEPSGSLPPPTEALALIPVFDDGSASGGQPTPEAFLLATVDGITNGSTPDPTTVILGAMYAGLLPPDLALTTLFLLAGLGLL